MKEEDEDEAIAQDQGQIEHVLPNLLHGAWVDLGMILVVPRL